MTDAVERARGRWPTRVHRASQRLRRYGFSELTLLPALVLAVIVGTVTSPAFLTTTNVVTILQGASELTVVTVALGLILIAGKFDLSLESTFGLAPMVGAWLILPKAGLGAGTELNPYLAIAVVFLVGILVGLINAFFVVSRGLNAFVVTLAMLILLRGVDLGLTNGASLYDLPTAYTYLGSAKWLGVPASIWIAGGVVAVADAFLRYHRFGRAIYAVGGNPDAARAAGIRVERVLAAVFVVGGCLAALGGLMLTGRIASSTASQGQNLIFTVFAAAVIGGVSLDGGRGRILGAFTGVLVLAIIQNILTLSQVPSFWINAVFGGVILVALIISQITESRAGRS